MTDDDDLRERLAAADPASRPALAAHIGSRSAQDIRERAMRTIDEAETPTKTKRRPLVAALAAAAAVAAVATGAAILTNDDGKSGKPAAVAAKTTLALTAPAGEVAASCIAFDVTFLREMQLAFAGTVTAITLDTVTLDVDRWYKGGSAGVVAVTNPAGSSVALDGVEFTAGGRFLVTATDSTVNGCGFSGAATAELEAAYAEAFGG